MRTGRLDALRVFIEKDRQQRAAILLRDVGYVIEGHFVLTKRHDTDERRRIAAKHISIFNRRAEQGQCFHRPCLGTRELAAHFAAVDGQPPFSQLPEDQRNRDLGWMLHDIDFANGATPRFFRAQLRGGVMEVPPFDTPDVKA